jgi:hypothetical protein
VASLFSIAGKPSFPIAGNSAATTTYGPVVGSRSKSAASQRLWLSVIRRDSNASTNADRSSSCSRICAVSCCR